MSNSNSSKQVLLSVIGIAILIIAVVGVAFAFFNYTRTGSANVIKVGRIYFNSEETGNAINLTNLFPIDVTQGIPNDPSKVGSITINVAGDTTYSEGIEYLIGAVDVSNGIPNSNKTLPISINIEASGLGTPDNNYYITREENPETSIYKTLARDTIEEGDVIVAGYIKSGVTGIDGTITIKAFLDNARVVISDTYPEKIVRTVKTENYSSSNCVTVLTDVPISAVYCSTAENLQQAIDREDLTLEQISLLVMAGIVDEYTNGTPSSFGEGKTVLTTEEWNSLQANGISFKIKVEANEGIWVEENKSISAVGTIPNELKENITEIHFIRENPIRMERRYYAATIKSDITDTTLNQGRVLAWKEGTILYIASTGETYLPENCSTYFAGISTIETIEFENINTSRVTNMYAMFAGLSRLRNIDLSSFDTSRVTNMSGMFHSCSSLVSIDLGGGGSSSLADISYIFTGCSNLEIVNMSGFNFGTNSSMFAMFNNCSKLVNVDLSNSITRYVTNMGALFGGCSSLTIIDLNGLGGLNLSNVSYMFSGCTNLEEVNMENFDFGVVQTIDLFKNLTNLETVNMANAKTLELRNISELFSGCTSLVSVDMTEIGRASLTNISNMFYNCTSLEEVNMTKFNFGSSNMNSLFRNLTSLKTVNLSNAITNNVYYFNSLFQDCTNLVTVDISGLDVNASKQLNSMFNNCTSLTTIYVTSITTDLSQIISSDNSVNMFYNCTSLTGGSGTTYDSNNIDSSYAHIDGGQSNPGYFTIKYA